MASSDKTLAKVLSGQADANIAFADLVGLLESFGFDHRQKGSHHIFTKSGVRQRINLQADGSKAKRYQVKQVRDVLSQNQFPEHE